MKKEIPTVYIVDDHNIVGEPSLECYTTDNFKDCVDYFEKLYWTKDSRYQQQSIRVFWDYKEAKEYRDKLQAIWYNRNNKESV
jgi:hypothetical protein